MLWAFNNSILWNKNKYVRKIKKIKKITYKNEKDGRL